MQDLVGVLDVQTTSLGHSVQEERDLLSALGELHRRSRCSIKRMTLSWVPVSPRCKVSNPTCTGSGLP